VVLSIERLSLLQQPVDQFLRTANRQGRDIVNGFFRIQLAALATRVLERINDVRMDAQQSQFENLE
jgi:hypothetical protein